MSVTNETLVATIVKIDGERQEITTSNNEDFIERVSEQIGNDTNAIIAFEEAYDQYQAQVGNVITVEALFDRGTVFVSRKAG